LNARSARPLQVGDRVRFNACSMHATGVIIDELTADYVLVLWSELSVPLTHRRSNLEADPSVDIGRSIPGCDTR
jgi:hypothetical protein